MNFVITLCLIYMLVLAVFFGARAFTADRTGKLRFFKSFKRGKFALIYLAAIPLFWIGMRSSGNPHWISFLNSVKCAVELVVLKFETVSIAGLLEINVLYRAAIGLCYSLVILNALMLTFALTGERLSNVFRAFRVAKFEKKVYVVVGFSENNQAVLNSVGNKNEAAILFCPLTTEIRDAMFIAKKACVHYDFRDDLGKTLSRFFGDLSNRSICVIVNTGDDAKNLILVQQLESAMANTPPDNFIEENKGLNAYVFGEPENESAFLRLVEKSRGRIRYVNKYKLIAKDFIGKYPLTEFMSAREIDYSTATLKPEIACNCVFIGFGKTNREIFKTSVENNQFLTIVDGIPVESPVNYFIYDKTDPKNDKNLNHQYFRYELEYDDFEKEKDDYFPLPSLPANTKFHEIDVNSPEFYKNVKGNLESERKIAYNYIIIAFGSDLENLDLAEKICAKLTEWKKKDYTKVFVKIRDARMSEEVFAKEYSESEGFLKFGNENKTVYRVSEITAEKFETMAKRRHLCYAMEAAAESPLGEGASCQTRANAGLVFEELEKKAIETSANEWYGEWSEVQRTSNVYGCLNLKTKLQLLGFDAAPSESPEKDARDDFYEAYEKDDSIQYKKENYVKNKLIVDYGECEFRNLTVRNILARQEHQRWNAYMISCGYVPAKIDEIFYLSKKELLDRRTHRNLTTWEGLSRYCDEMCARTGKSKRETDVLKYDYQLADDADWLLKSLGWKIVLKEGGTAYLEERKK